jgi:hypothetical protein
VQDLVQPSIARANVVCLACANSAIKEYHRVTNAKSPQKGERAPPAKRTKSVSGIGASGVFDMYCVNMHDNMQTNRHAKKIEHACCCCDVTTCVSTCNSYEEHVRLWGPTMIAHACSGMEYRREAADASAYLERFH